MTAASDVAPRNLAVERVAVDRLRPHPRNPRRIRPERLEQLKRSLEAEPEMLDARPLIALPDGTVVAGNQRLAAAIALGWSEIPVVFANLTPERATEWMLRDNQGYGEQLDDLAGELLAELAAAGGDLDLTGYEPGAVDALLRAAAARDVDPDEAPPLPAKARSRLGEVYELGPHRLMCGDATDAEQVAELLSTSPVLTITSPPYGVGKEYERASDWSGLIEKWVPLVSAPVAVVNLADRRVGESQRESHTYGELITLMTSAGLPLIGTRIWVKTAAAWSAGPYWLSSYRAVDDWEYMGLFGAVSYTDRIREEWRFRGVWEMATVAANDIHPAMFPVELPSRWIQLLTDRGEAIYDPFAGSGATLIAAEQIGRRCYAMEIDPAYCDVIRDRYAQFVA